MLFRIVFGVLILIYLGLMTAEFDLCYTGGPAEGNEAREAAGPLPHFRRSSTTDRSGDCLRRHLALPRAWLTLGWRTRVMSIFLSRHAHSLSPQRLGQWWS